MSPPWPQPANSSYVSPGNSAAKAGDLALRFTHDFHQRAATAAMPLDPYTSGMVRPIRRASSAALPLSATNASRRRATNPAAALTSADQSGNRPAALSAPNKDTVAGPKPARPRAPSAPTSHHGMPAPATSRASSESLPIPTTRAPRASDCRAAATVSGESPHATTATRQSGPTNVGTSEL